MGLACLIAAAALPVAAAETAKRCEAVDIAPQYPVAYARIAAGASKTNFVKGGEAKGCPSAAAACRGRSFVLAGDVVLYAKAAGDFVCAEYVSPKGFVTAGFLPTAAIAPGEPPAIAPERWLGKWRTGDHQQIDIARGKTPGELRVSGEATWGLDDPDRVKNGGVHDGSFSAAVKPRGGLIEIATDVTSADEASKPFDDPDTTLCKLRVEFEVDTLFVEDNGNCGGENVRFDGSYKRR